MEPIDTAFAEFRKIRSGLPALDGTVISEADTRLKIIDPILNSVLGWPLANIECEDQAGTGYIDYKCTVGDLARLIVEAKKERRHLGFTRDRSGRYFKLSGPVFPAKSTVSEGIEQAIRYCGHKNAELACVTNGHEWLVFRGNRLGDGKDTLEGLGCVFADLDGVEAKFKLFWDLLAFESVEKYRYRANFNEAEGQPIRARSFKREVKSPNDKSLLSASDLARDVDRVMVSFFQNLTTSEDAEMLRDCFVTSAESESAEANLSRISEELKKQIQSLKTSEAAELIETVKRVRDMNSRAFGLIVGTKGAGKSTFIDRFFHDVLPQEIAKECRVIRIDLSDSGCDENSITSWLNQSLLAAAEDVFFGGNPPTYEQLQGMYFDQYQRRSEGTQKHLYESDKNAFKIKFGDYIEEQRTNFPHEYITRMLVRVVKSEKKVPCLVFDNADHFTIEFQERVFQYAHSIYKKVLCLVLVPLTDKTSWQLSKQGALQSFYTESFYLPTPSTQMVLQRRIEYIQAQIETEEKEKRGYFTAKGIPFEIDDINGLANGLQQIFIASGRVSEWIGNLANSDIRRCLKLTRQIATSPHLGFEELLKLHFEKSTTVVDQEKTKLAIIRGSYDTYPSGQHEFVQNVFAMNTEVETSPLLGLRILTLLEDVCHTDASGESQYISVDQVLDYFVAMGFETRVVRCWVDEMLRCALCWSYDPTITSVSDDSRIEISPSGRQHLSWAVDEWTYLESMLEVTPIMSQDVHSQLSKLSYSNTPSGRRSAMQLFLDYVLSEDANYCQVPDHESYAGQTHLRSRLQNEKDTNLAAVIPIEDSIRYGRATGKAKRWNDEKAFGFVRLDDSLHEVFVHLNDIVDGVPLKAGDKVALDVVRTEKGDKGVGVARL